MSQQSDRVLLLRPDPAPEISSHLFRTVGPESETDLDAAIVLDESMFDTHDSPARLIGWVSGSSADASLVTRILQDVDALMARFELIVTPVRELIGAHPRILFHPAPLAHPSIPLSTFALYRKDGLFSIDADATSGVHWPAERIAAMQATSVKNNMKNSSLPPFHRHCFHVCVDTPRRQDGAVRDLMNCLATGTVPVIADSEWPTEVTERNLDLDGLVLMDSDFSADLISEDRYFQMLPAIRKNYRRISSQMPPADLLYLRYLKPMPDNRDQTAEPAWEDWDLSALAQELAADSSSDSAEKSFTFDEQDHLPVVQSATQTVIDELDCIPEDKVIRSAVRSVTTAPQSIYPRQQPSTYPLRFDTAFLVHLREAYIGDNIIFDAEHYYALDRWWGGAGGYVYEQTHEVRHVGAAICVSAWCGSAFQHFMLDAMPQLSAVIDLLEDERFAQIGLVSHLEDNPFSQWVWKRLGLEGRVEQKPFNAKEGFVVHADHAFFFHCAPNARCMGHYPRYCLLPLQRRLGVLDGGERDLVINLSRRGRVRALADDNEDALLARLEPLVADAGLTLKTYKSEGDWDRDLDVLRRARIILGPHGGALGNVVFAPPGTDVIEFVSRPEGGPETNGERAALYYGLSQAAGHHYWRVEPDEFDFEGERIRVPVADVVAVVHRILGSA